MLTCKLSTCLKEKKRTCKSSDEIDEIPFNPQHWKHWKNSQHVESYSCRPQNMHTASTYSHHASTNQPIYLFPPIYTRRQTSRHLDISLLDAARKLVRNQYKWPVGDLHDTYELHICHVVSCISYAQPSRHVTSLRWACLRGRSMLHSMCACTCITCGTSIRGRRKIQISVW